MMLEIPIIVEYFWRDCENIIIPLNTNAKDETVFAICRIGLCTLAASQKQPVFKQVAGCQSFQTPAGKTDSTRIVTNEIMTAIKMENIVPDLLSTVIRV